MNLTVRVARELRAAGVIKTRRACASRGWLIEWILALEDVVGLIAADCTFLGEWGGDRHSTKAVRRDCPSIRRAGPSDPPQTGSSVA
jgi:hypothetical protein